MIVFSSLFAAFLAILGGGVIGARRACCSNAYNALQMKARLAQKLWRKAGMRSKVKLFVGLYQCIAAVPSVYDVVVPSTLDHLTRWVDLIELPSDLGVNLIIPAECFGSYRRWFRVVI